MHRGLRTWTYLDFVGVTQQVDSWPAVGHLHSVQCRCDLEHTVLEEARAFGARAKAVAPAAGGEHHARPGGRVPAHGAQRVAHLAQTHEVVGAQEAAQVE